MADRLKFKFIQKGTIERSGIVSVDVADPMNVNEIRDKLSSKKFASYLVDEQDIADSVFSFEPYIEES